MNTRKFIIATSALPALGAALLGSCDRQPESASTQPDASNTFSDAAARTIDPKLITWKQAEEIDTGLNTLDSFARLADTHIVCVGGNALKILPRAGGPSTKVTLSAESKAVAVTADRIFVGVRDHVELFDTAGRPLAAWPTFGKAAVITAIALAGDSAYVADAGQRVVYRTDLAGKILERFAQRDESKHAPGLVLPSPHLDVALHHDILWINNPGRHELEGFDSTGTMIRRWGEPGMTIEKFAGCCNPTDFAIFPDGRFVTSEKGIPRVKIYSPTGELQSVVAGPETFGADVGGMDVSIDAAGRVWVAENTKGLIRIFKRK